MRKKYGPTYSKTISTACSEYQKNQLLEIARKTNRSLSEVSREAIIDLIDKYETEGN